MVQTYGVALIVVDVLLLLLKILYFIGESIYRIIVPVREKSVVGEIVLITGAGHGIGKELALKYASLGATVVCWDLNPQTNNETVKEIKKLGAVDAYAYVCDVSNKEEVFKVADQVRKEVGNVTILINNAGIMPCHTFFDHTPEEIRKIFDINVMAHFWTLQAFLPNMIANNHGHIVALSSMAGMTGVPNLVPYCASKYAVRGIMEALNEELRTTVNEKASNINLTVICPYMVDTGLCKKPVIRFENFMAMVPPKTVADHIITAQRRNELEISIPRHWLPVTNIMRNLPIKAQNSIKNFFGSGVEPTES